MPQFASTVPNPRQNISLRDRRQPVEEYEAERNAEELANLRLQHDMAWQQAFRDATDDPDNAKIIWDKVRSQTSTLPATEGAVKSAFTNYATGQVPQWSARFTDMQRAVKKKNLLDQSEINYETAIEVGNAEAARAALARQSTIDPGREAINKQRSLELDAAVPLRQAERALARGDIDGAKEAVLGLNTDDMTVGQRQAVARLNQTIAAAETDERRALYAEWTGMAASVRDLSAVERSAAISTIRAAINSPDNARRMSTEELRAFNSFLDRMGKGEDWDSDPMVRGDLLTEAMGMQDATPATKQAYRAKIDQAWVDQQLSSTHHGELLKMAIDTGAIPSKEMAGTIESVSGSAKIRGLVDDVPGFEYDLLQAAKKNGWTPEETHAQGNIMAASGKWKVGGAKSADPFPVSDLRKLLGVIYLGEDEKFAYDTKVSMIAYLAATVWFDPRLSPSQRDLISKALDKKYPGEDARLPSLPGLPSFGPQPGVGSAPGRVAPGTPLDATTADRLMEEENGDEERVRQRAKELGYAL